MANKNEDAEKDAQDATNEVNSDYQFDHDAPRRGSISQSTCRMISYVTQFVVAGFAIAAFIVAVLYSVKNLTKRQIIESKELVSKNEAWLKFAICLRPLMTSSLLREVYESSELVDNYEDILRDFSEDERRRWNGTFILDETLRWEEYQTFLKEVHPWKKQFGERDINIPIEKIWNYLNDTIKESFVEFKVNKKRIRGTDTPHHQNFAVEKNAYTVLPSPKKKCHSCKEPTLTGDYTLSPLYAGCVNVTVNEDMSKRQMEISIKFRNSRSQRSKKNDSQVDIEEKRVQVTLFQAVDLFVLHSKEHFTEIPVIQEFTKFSVLANSLERLLVTGSSHEKQPSYTGRTCHSDPEYSQTNCRHECIMKALLNGIKCTIPWMESLKYKPWATEKHQHIPKCAEAKTFLKTLEVQRQYLDLNSEGKEYPKPVRKCITKCPEPCITYKVSLLSLGGKSIGKNYGISLTVSPELSVVKEYYDYDIANMVAELSASISFLLGLSAIAIYDWLFAFGAWAAVKLGMVRDETERHAGWPAPPTADGENAASELAV